jgi:hypothetical protein
MGYKQMIRERKCEFCEDPEQYGVSAYFDSAGKKYSICVECRKRSIARLSRQLGDIFESLPKAGAIAIAIDETRKAVEFNLSTGRTRPRFLNPEDLK